MVQGGLRPLTQKIALARPQFLLVFGPRAAHDLLNDTPPFSDIRGKVHYYREQKIPFVATYHPEDLLMHPEKKAEAYKDLKLARATLEALGFSS